MPCFDFLLVVCKLDDGSFIYFFFWQTKTLYTSFPNQRLLEGLFGIGQVYQILRSFWSRNGWGNGGEVQLHNLGIIGLTVWIIEEMIFLGIGLCQGNVVFIPVGQSHIVEGFRINGEIATGRAVFRCHVGNGGPIRQGKAGQTRTKELDELSDNIFLTKELSHFQGQIGSGCNLGQLTSQMHPDNFRNREIRCFSQHSCFCFNPSNTPAKDTDTIDHSCVAVCTKHGVWVELAILFDDDITEKFDIDLVDNTRSWRNRPVIVKGLFSPLEELIALIVALELQVNVFFKSWLCSVEIYLNRVVNDQINWNFWIDEVWISAIFHNGIPHGSKVHYYRNACKILQNNTARLEGNFAFRFGCRIGHQILNVIFSNIYSVIFTQETFQ